MNGYSIANIHNAKVIYLSNSEHLLNTFGINKNVCGLYP